jgi:hypothetical protein
MLISDARLGEMLAAAEAQEQEIRRHLAGTQDRAAEQERGLAVYRHAVAARQSLEAWIRTRTFRAQGVGLEGRAHASR